MANILTRFKKQVVGSDGRIFDYLTVITSSGDFKRISNLNVIINSWNTILLTPKGTYLFDPEFGSDIHKLIFEPADSGTVERIKNEVEESLLTYDDRADIENIEVFLKPDGKSFQVDIEVSYEGEKGKLSVTFDDTTTMYQGVTP